jgi:hypothetical protein
MVIATICAGTEAGAAGRVPVLAGPWAGGQQGYGHVRPRTIFNGGDPTGLVTDIHWRSWGGRRAIGTGTGFWVKPREIVVQGHFEKGARIVLFHRGRCHGRPAYNAIERYYPRHGQKFSPGDDINACTGKYYTNGHPDL